MANSLYIPMSGALAAQRNLDVVANDLANVDTAGYKRIRATFRSHLVRSVGATPETKGFAAMDETRVDTTQGTLLRTGNPLDVAIEGPGYLVLDGPDGPLLTRAGSLRVNERGILVDASGMPVRGGSLGPGASPIQVSPDGGTVAISSDGTVSQGGTDLAKLVIVNATNLTHRGDSYYTAPPQEIQPSSAPRVLAGHLEGSNVDPVRGMIRLIELSRAFETQNRVMRQFRDLDRSTMDVAG